MYFDFLPDNRTLYYANDTVEDGDLIANFRAKPIKAIYEKTDGVSEDAPPCSVVIELLDGSNVKTICVPYNKLKNLDFSSYGVFYCLPEKHRKLMINSIYYQLPNAEEERVKIIKQRGWVKISNVNCYCVGNKLIHADELTEGYYIEPNLQKHAGFADHTKYSEKQAADAMLSLISLTPSVSDIIVAGCGLGYMKSLVTESSPDGKEHVPISLFLFGPTGTFKSSFMKLAASFSKPVDNFVRVRSTTARIEVLQEIVRDQILILDDWNKSSIKQDEEGKEVVIDSIRTAADNEPRQTMRKTDSKINASIMVTAEKPLDVPTNIGRVLHIPVGRPGNGLVPFIDGEKLAVCQKDPMAIPTFWENFLEWVSGSERYNNIVTGFRDALSRYRESGESTENYKVLEAKPYYKYAFRLILTYIKEVSGYENLDIDKAVSDFSDNLCELIENQNEYLKAMFNKDIFEQYPGRFISALVFAEDEKCICRSVGNMCYLRDNNTCLLNTRDFRKYLEDNFGISCTEKHIVGLLRKDGLLVNEDDRKSKERYHDKRYTVLDLDELKRRHR